MCHLNKETGLSVPDAEMLISISEVLDTPVSTLLGESIRIDNPNDLKVISEKLEIINLQLSQTKILALYFFINMFNYNNSFYWYSSHG